MELTTEDGILAALYAYRGDLRVGRSSSVEELLLADLLASGVQPGDATALLLSAARVAWSTNNGDALKHLARVVNRLRGMSDAARDQTSDWVRLALNDADELRIRTDTEGVAALAAIAAKSPHNGEVNWAQLVVKMRAVARDLIGNRESAVCYALRDICFYAAIGSIAVDDYTVYLGATEGMMDAEADFGAEFFTIAREILSRKNEAAAMAALTSCGRAIMAQLSLRRPEALDRVESSVNKAVGLAIEKVRPSVSNVQQLQFKARVRVMHDGTSTRELLGETA